MFVLLKDQVQGVRQPDFSETAWFPHVKLLFWTYPGDFYVSLPRAVLNIFSGWLAAYNAW